LEYRHEGNNLDFNSHPKIEEKMKQLIRTYKEFVRSGELNTPAERVMLCLFENLELEVIEQFGRTEETMVMR